MTEKKRTWSVYKHTCKKNNLVYIGIAVNNPKSRWNNGKGYIANWKFYNDIKKYGWDKGFTHEILIDDIPTKQEALELELQYIHQYYFDPVYNESVKNKFNEFGLIYYNNYFPDEYYRRGE